MGNQPSSQKKQAELGGGNRDPVTPSAPSYHLKTDEPSSIPCSPDIVFSSQVPATTSHRLPSYLPHRQRHEPDSDIPSSPMLPKPNMSSTIKDAKVEIPESPDYKQEASSPSYKRKQPSIKKRESLTSQLDSSIMSSFVQNKATSVKDSPTVGDVHPRSDRKKRRGRRAKDKGQKKAQWPASPDLGNDHLPNTSAQKPRTIDIAEPHDAQQDPFLSHPPTSSMPLHSTPSNGSLSKKRKTIDSGSRSRKRSKRNHAGHNKAINGTPFSSLAESLYASRKNGGDVKASENDSVINNTQEQSPRNAYPRRTSQDSATLTSNANKIDMNLGPATNPRAISDGDDDSKNEMEVGPNQNHSIPYSRDQRNSLDAASYNGNGPSSDNSQLDNKDQMIHSRDSRSGEESENGELGDGGESARSANSAPKTDRRLNGTVKSLDSPGGDGSTSVVPRPKQGSARKRFVKPTFYQRLSEGDVDGIIGPASSSPVAGPSNSTRRKQPKISAMLKGNPEDSSESEASSSKHRAPPNVKKQRPQEVTKGQFSDLEIRNITRAVERWRDNHNMTQFEVNELIQSNPREVSSSDFWARVAATCPNRGRQKVINQCRRKFHNFVARGTWTPEQQEELKEMWEQYGNKYSQIGKLINRHPEDVRDRVRNYVMCGEHRRVDAWTEDEEESLQFIIGEALQMIRSRREEGHLISDEADDDLIDWQRVSERMGRTRSRLQCIQKWKSLSRQRAAGISSIDGEGGLSVKQIIQKAREEAADLSSRHRYAIVKAIRAFDVNAESRIPWAKVRTQQLKNRWTRPVLMLVWYRLKHLVPDWHIMTVPEITQQLSAKYHETRELHYPTNDDYDLNAEFSDIERKINKILKAPRAPPKTPNIVVKTDDEDEEEEEFPGGEDESSEDGENSEEIEESQNEEEEAANDMNDDSGKDDEGGKESEVVHEMRDEIEEDSQQNGEDDESDSPSNQPENEDEDGDTSMRDGPIHESGGSVNPGHNEEAQEAENARREPSITSRSPSVSDFKPRKSRASQKRYKSLSKAAKPERPTLGRFKSSRMIIDESSEDEQVPDPEELSSDTNASEVESIPAHL